MRAHTSTLSLTGRSINHGSRARGPKTHSLVVVREWVPGLSSSVHLFVIPAVKLSLNRPAASPLFRDPTNSDFAVATSTVGSRVGIVQAELLLFVVSALVGFMSYTSIPGLIRIQCAEAAPVSPSVGTEGG